MLAVHPQAQMIVYGALQHFQQKSSLASLDPPDLAELFAGVEGPVQMRKLFSSIPSGRRSGGSLGASSGLVFIHIMKTAGTSFFSALQLASGENGVWVNFDTLAVLPEEIRSTAPLIAGHIPLDAQKLIGRDRKYLTILRDPRERVLSHFHEVVSIMTIEGRDPIPTIDEFLWEQRWNGLASNYQTRQLGHQIRVETLGSEWSATEEFVKLGPSFPIEHPFPLSSLFDSEEIDDWNVTFDSAKRAIEKIDLVLTTENLQTSPDLIHEVTGLEVGEITRANTRDHDGYASMPALIRRRIDDLNDHDLELWRQAQRRFQRDIENLNRVVKGR